MICSARTFVQPRTDRICRNLSNTSLIPIGAGSSHCSTSSIVLHLHVCLVSVDLTSISTNPRAGDMKINGPYYSDVLMNAVLSHSVRWCKAEPQVGPLLDSYDGGALFYQRAVTGLFDSLKTGYAGIPTIQILLLLSAQECGRGNRTQAWLYSGMAFRILDDLGISIDSRKYPGSAHLSDEDIEIRNRLFWSCYFWDKIISLYFGRAPTMQHSRVSPPRMIRMFFFPTLLSIYTNNILVDDTSEIEIWTPHGVTFPDGAHYPPTQAHSTTCFIQMCGLAEILNQILVHVYDPMRQSTEAEFFDCVQEQAKNLGDWWDELPDYLRLVATDLPPYSPPSHIMTLKYVLYFMLALVFFLLTRCQLSISHRQYSASPPHPLFSRSAEGPARCI